MKIYQVAKKGYKLLYAVITYNTKTSIYKPNLIDKDYLWTTNSTRTVGFRIL